MVEVLNLGDDVVLQVEDLQFSTQRAHDLDAFEF